MRQVGRLGCEPFFSLLVFIVGLFSWQVSFGVEPLELSDVLAWCLNTRAE